MVMRVLSTGRWVNGFFVQAFANGVTNVILMQFTISPARNIATEGTWEADEVFFDPTRQVWGHRWLEPSSVMKIELISSRRYFPVELELPNDDASNNDESERVTGLDHFYSADGPGENSDVAQPSTTLVWRGNFMEWLRVGFGTRPAGNTIAGSRVSAYYNWHVAHTVVDTNGVWARTTGDDPESDWINSIGDGHMNRTNGP